MLAGKVPPPQPRWRLSIQLPYCNNDESILEYSDAFFAGRIDWVRIVGQVCPICGARDCWRPIGPYWRTVIELLPYRETRIPVARFQCQATGKTFSMLPHWLAPYHRYTVASMLFALLLAAAMKEQGLSSLFSVAEKLLDPDCRVNGFLLGCWLVLGVVGLRRAHAELSRWSELDGVKQGWGVTGRLCELRAYCQALGIRGPPDAQGVDAVLARHARTTKRFLFGVPSQERGA